MRRLLFLALLFAFSASGSAATLVADSASYQHVKDKVDLAARGDTVSVPAGSSNWGSSTLYLQKGIELIGAGRDSTFITSSGGITGSGAVYIQPDATANTNDELIKVEGFTFDGGNVANNLVILHGTSTTKAFKNAVVINCRLRNTHVGSSGSGAFRTNGQIRGVIAGNIIDRCNVILKALGSNDSGQEWASGNFPFAYGSLDNLYFENNDIIFSSTYAGNIPGWIESGQGGRVCVRYNRWNMTNATHADELWDVHGFQNWAHNGQTGTMIAEYYGNTASNCKGFRWISHRGSWGLFHNNIVTSATSYVIHASQYGTTDGGGSGCTAQVPGATGVYVTEINNTYVFNNTVNGSERAMTLNGALPQHCGIAENANFWNYNASFTGATGIGRGTDTPTMSATNGVAYWKNATATPSIDPTIVQAGHLYKRVAGAWVDYYTPYTYPHPLVANVPGPPTITAHPQAATKWPSESVTFAVTPAGTLPFTYQWKKGGVNISGETGATYSISSVVSGDAGNYSVTVTNSAGNVTSNTAALTVSALLGLTFDADDGRITAPFTVTGSTVAQTVVTSVPTDGGKAEYYFDVEEAGDYTIDGTVNCPDGGSNSFFVAVDAEPTAPANVWYVPVTSGAQVRPVTWGIDAAGTGSNTTKVFTLTEGTHRLVVRGREANAILASFTFVPKEEPVDPPGTIGGFSPADSATDVAVSANLSWTVTGTAATSYDVYLGTTDPPLLAENGGGILTTNYSPTVLAHETVYYWYIVAHNVDGSTTSSQVSFTTVDAPIVYDDPPSNPQPADNATNVVTTEKLKWISANKPFHVRFGITDPPPIVYTSNVSVPDPPAPTEYNPGTLAFAREYFWRIDLVQDDASIVSSPTWSFTTVAEPSPTPPPDTINVFVPQVIYIRP